MRLIMLFVALGLCCGLHADIAPKAEVLPFLRNSTVTELIPGNLSHFKVESDGANATSWTIFYRDDDRIELRVNDRYFNPAASAKFATRSRAMLNRVARRTIKALFRDLHRSVLTDPIDVTRATSPDASLADRLTHEGWASLSAELVRSTLSGWKIKEDHVAKKISLFFDLESGRQLNIRYAFQKARKGSTPLRWIEIEDFGVPQRFTASLKYRNDQRQIEWLARLGRDKLEEITSFDPLTGKLSTSPTWIQSAVDCVASLFLGPAKL